MTTKQEYLQLRPFIIIGQFNNSVMKFLSQWCEQENRRFDILMHILEIASKHGFVGDLLNRLVIFLDRKFAINKAWNVETGNVVKIY